MHPREATKIHRHQPFVEALCRWPVALDTTTCARQRENIEAVVRGCECVGEGGETADDPGHTGLIRYGGQRGQVGDPGSPVVGLQVPEGPGVGGDWVGGGREGGQGPLGGLVPLLCQWGDLSGGDGAQEVGHLGCGQNSQGDHGRLDVLHQADAAEHGRVPLLPVGREHVVDVLVGSDRSAQGDGAVGGQDPERRAAYGDVRLAVGNPELERGGTGGEAARVGLRCGDQARVGGARRRV